MFYWNQNSSELFLSHRQKHFEDKGQALYDHSLLDKKSEFIKWVNYRKYAFYLFNALVCMSQISLETMDPEEP